MITASIDVTKLDKSKFFKGKKGIYANLVLIECDSNEYGHDYIVKQDASKEERKLGVQMPIIGNAKRWKRVGAVKEAMEKPKEDTGDTSVPF